MVGPSAKKSAFDYLKEKYETSTSLICRTLNLSRSTKYRKVVKDDSEVESKLKALAEQYSTRGFDWYYMKIRLEGLKWNRKRVLRVYRKLNLKMRRKHKRRINRPKIEALSQPIMPNITWSMDFMSDSLEDGRQVRVLTVIDDYNRQCLKLECGISIPSDRVIRALNVVIEERGIPKSIRTDNGPEFTSNKFAQWCEKNQIKHESIQPGKPYQNGYIERFNRTYREDVLDAYVFEGIKELQIVSESWQIQYNTGHPHQSLNGMTPVGFEYSRHKEIAAYEKVKSKMNDSLQSSDLTYSPPAIKRRLHEIQME